MVAFAVAAHDQEFVGGAFGGDSVEVGEVVGEELPLGWVVVSGEWAIVGISLVYEAEIGGCLLWLVKRSCKVI